MNDTISRAAAITLFEKYGAEEDAIALLNSLPPAQPGWIPCKTALPEHDGEYLVTIKAFTIDQAVYADIDIARYTGGKWRKGFPVTAWQPLPTPYREGGQDDQS